MSRVPVTFSHDTDTSKASQEKEEGRIKKAFGGVGGWCEGYGGRTGIELLTSPALNLYFGPRSH